MNNFFIGITDNNNYKGYSSSVESLIKGTEAGSGVLFDMSNKNYLSELKKVIEENKSKNIHLIVGGGYGLNTIKNIGIDGVEFIYCVDRYNDGDNLEGIEKLVIIAPKAAIDIFKEHKFGCTITGIEADLVACKSKSDMEKDSNDFELKNEEVCKNTKLYLESVSSLFFMGGRGEGFPLNKKEVFEKAANDYLKKIGKENGIVCFHGLRSFTDLVDGEDKKLKSVNNFEAVEKFYKAIEDGLKPNQTVEFLTQKLSEDGKRIPILKIMSKDDQGKINNTEENLNGNIYYWLMNNSKDKELLATAEQMNFPSECLELGIPKGNINHYDWELMSEQHEATHKNLDAIKLIANREAKNAINAFKEYYGILCNKVNSEKTR